MTEQGVRGERREEAILAFERKRDDAQLAAARDQAEQGNVETAEKILTTIIDRNPNHAAARLLLADLWASQDRTEEAERQLRLLLERDPQNSPAHHALGLLLDVAERTDEAARHFRRAAELAPDNETFRLSHEAARQPSSTAKIAHTDR